MSEPTKNSALLGEALLEAIRGAVRVEIRAALTENGHGVEKPTEIPILSPIL